MRYRMEFESHSQDCCCFQSDAFLIPFFTNLVLKSVSKGIKKCINSVMYFYMRRDMIGLHLTHT